MEEVKRYTIEEAHRHFAIALNGTVWDLLQKSDRSQSENELMVHAAHTSCYHWLQVGNGLHHQRAEWLIAHVYTELGFKCSALRHAERCLELTSEFESLMQDFDHAYAFEAAARANALAENREEALEYLRLAEEAANAIVNDEDKNIFMNDLNNGNWYGLR
jgi:hypothetical protein